MEFQFHGANAIQINTKKAKVLVDPIGATPAVKVDKKIDIVLATQERFADKIGDAFLISSPGEYEISGLSFKGISAQAHIDETGVKNATIFKIMDTSFNIAILGHVDTVLSDEDLEAIGTIDVLIIPVGGNGYTLDAEGAAKLVRSIEPKVVIPTHYKMDGVTYDMPQAELELFMKELGVSEHEKMDKYKVKGEFPDKLTVIELEVS